MTEAVLLTGKRGTGKSLSAVKMAKRYIAQGRIVATNLDLFVEKLASPSSKMITYRLPDIPTSSVLEALPVGNPNPVDEDKNGLLILDETAGYLNSRDWKDKDRTALIAWLAQSRKYGWDLVLIAQHAGMIDKQIRDALCDVHGVCRTTDKVGIPVITWFFWHFFEIKIMMPKFHIASFYYGFGQSAPKSYSDWFNGTEVREGYDTLQKISEEFGQQGLSSNLSAWHLRGRYLTRWQMHGKIALTGMIIGALFGVFGGYWYGHRAITASDTLSVMRSSNVDEKITVTGTVQEGFTYFVILSDGRQARSTDFKFDLDGASYKVGSTWYREKK